MIVDVVAAVCDAVVCGVPDEVQGVVVGKDGDSLVLAWEPELMASEYQVWGAEEPGPPGGFAELGATSAERFQQPSESSTRFDLVTASGPDGP